MRHELYSGAALGHWRQFGTTASNGSHVPRIYSGPKSERASVTAPKNVRLPPTTPRLAFNRIVVVRYRMHLESRGLAANTINQHLAAVRRLAHEAADLGLR
jgi:hypothetical protein